MNIMAVAWKAYFSLPPGIRRTLRVLLKGEAGHTSSVFNRMIAMRDARGKCRIDRCARLWSGYLTAAGMAGIEGRRCLEVGTGTVGSGPVVMWLLGAREVTSVDLNPLLVVEALKESILPVDKAELTDILRKHVTSVDALTGRIDRIYAWARSTRKDLPACVSYLAPFDVLAREFHDNFDFVFSASTLEHIPRRVVGSFVGRLASVSARDGAGLHSIDLADHFDSLANPLGFLALNEREYSDDADADSRGNRIRGGEWLDMFFRAGLAADIVLSESAPRAHLPGTLAEPFRGMKVEELLVTSILVRTRKSAGRMAAGANVREGC
jgi:hypothetical protein